MSESIGIAVQVLSDWRVIAVAVATLLVWTLLRYVGVVYRKPRLPSSKKAGGRAVAGKGAASKAPRKAAPAQAAAGPEAGEGDDEEMVE
jgi:hypothetical protein